MFTFTTRIRPHVQGRLDAALAAERRGEFYTAFLQMERAHVLGQSSTREHVRVHWHMLRFALRNRQFAASWGQSWRLVAAALFTPFGLLPHGNTGGTDVNGFERMQVPQELRAVIEAARG